MKIYLTGSHATGKSTLCRYISNTYNLYMLPETARSVLSERELQIDSLRADINLADSYQQEVFNRQIAEEENYDNFVSDRSAVDCVVYSFAHSRIGHRLVADKRFKHYLEKLKDNKSIVFLVRPSKATLKDDGVRETINWDSIVSIDAQIKLLLELYEIRYFQINTDNMSDRIKQVNYVISLTK
jgi:dephospho-CoA kinase